VTVAHLTADGRREMDIYDLVNILNPTARQAHEYAQRPWEALTPGGRARWDPLRESFGKNIVSRIGSAAIPEAKYKADLRADPDFDPLAWLGRATTRGGMWDTPLEARVGFDTGVSGATGRRFRVSTPEAWRAIANTVPGSTPRTPAEHVQTIASAVGAGASDRGSLQYSPMLNDYRWHQIAWGPKYRGNYQTSEGLVNELGDKAFLGMTPQLRMQLANYFKINRDYARWHELHPNASRLPFPDYTARRKLTADWLDVPQWRASSGWYHPGPPSIAVGGHGWGVSIRQPLRRIEEQAPGALGGLWGWLRRQTMPARDAGPGASCHRWPPAPVSEPTVPAHLSAACRTAHSTVLDLRCLPAHAAPLLANCHRGGGAAAQSALGLTSLPGPGSYARAARADHEALPLGLTTGNPLVELKNLVVRTQQDAPLLARLPSREAAGARALPTRSTYAAARRAITVVTPGLAPAERPPAARPPAQGRRAAPQRHPARSREQALAFARAHGYIPAPPAPAGAWRTVAASTSSVPAAASSSSTAASTTTSAYQRYIDYKHNQIR
jgi:hypothetical protein